MYTWIAKLYGTPLLMICQYVFAMLFCVMMLKTLDVGMECRMDIEKRHGTALLQNCLWSCIASRC